ncbi:unnamed protein product [Mucor hiemalis]
MFNKSISTILLLIAFFFTLASAIVINPHITTPNSKTKWRAGQTVTIKWDTTYTEYGSTTPIPIPDNLSGNLKLGYLEGGDQYNEHLQWDLNTTPFKLNAGSYTVTLPSDLITRNGYIIVLMGNSGNASPKFKIGAAV